MRTLAFLVVGVLSFLSLAGCSALQDGEEVQPAQLNELRSQVATNPFWSGVLAGSLGSKHQQFSLGFLGDRVFVPSREGRVVAASIETGKAVWEADIGLSIASGITVADGKVIVGSADGELLALAALSGEELWRVAVGSEISAPAAIGGGRVVVQSVDGRLQAFDAEGGRLLWSYSAQQPSLTLRGTAEPVIEGPRVFAGFANGKLLAFSLSDGEQLWESRIAIPEGRSELERMVDLDGRLLVGPGVLYAVTYQGQLAAVSQTEGRVLWSRALSSYQGVGIEGSVLAVAAADGELVAYDTRSSSELWRQRALYYRQPTMPIGWGGHLISGDLEGYLHWISPVDGSLVGRRQLGDDAIVNVSSYQGRLFVLAKDGTVTVFNAD